MEHDGPQRSKHFLVGHHRLGGLAAHSDAVRLRQQVLGVDLEPDLALVALLAEARARAEEGGVLGEC